MQRQSEVLKKDRTLRPILITCNQMFTLQQVRATAVTNTYRASLPSIHSSSLLAVASFLCHSSSRWIFERSFHQQHTAQYASSKQADLHPSWCRSRMKCSGQKPLASCFVETCSRTQPEPRGTRSRMCSTSTSPRPRDRTAIVLRVGSRTLSSTTFTVASSKGNPRSHTPPFRIFGSGSVPQCSGSGTNDVPRRCGRRAL